MLQADSIEVLRATLNQWRASDQKIAFVPTMGNLHDGHLSLVNIARQSADRVVASIFVNPLQFGPDEDFENYPRTPQKDFDALSQSGCDLLFSPSVAQMYPSGVSATHIEVGAIGNQLCGAFRAGHFDGMATVVVKLLNQVQPDIAVFGQKDYQQLMVIRQVITDLDMQVQVKGAPTARGADGLALSSRNRYLSEQERSVAPMLYQELSTIAEQIRGGKRNYQQLTANSKLRLAEVGFRPDYIEVRSANLGEPAQSVEGLVVLGAAWLGKARLIDNVIVDF